MLEIVSSRLDRERTYFLSSAGKIEGDEAKACERACFCMLEIKMLIDYMFICLSLVIRLGLAVGQSALLLYILSFLRQT